jgi:tetratricopeptide (TPR) repeat protein
LQAVLEARLAALEPTARRVLRAASVFGRALSAAGVAALVRDLPIGEVDATLAKLVEREVLLRRGEPGHSTGDREYAFRHALIRDVAYGTLTDEDRRLGHRLAAAWLQRADTAVPALVLAEHHQRGGMRGRAAGFWRRAADQALAGDDLAAALERAERAIDCGATGVSLGAVQLIQAEVRRWRGDNAGALELARQAMDTLPRSSSRWYAAIGEAATAAVELDDVGKLRELAALLAACTWDEKAGGPQIEAGARLTLALVAARELGAADELLARVDRIDEARLRGEPLVLGRVYHARGLRAQVHGDLGQAVDLGQAAYAHFQQAGDRRSAVLSAVTVGDASRQLGGYASARVALREALHAAEALGLTQVADTARLHLGAVLARTGFLAEAAEVERAAIAGHRASGNVRALAAARARRAEVMAMEGSHADAESEICSALGELAEGAPPRGELLAVLAWVRLRAGRPEPARDAAAAALEALEPGSDGFGDYRPSVPPPSRSDAGGAHAALARLTLAEALQATGDFARAAAAIRDGRQRVLERAARISSELHRQSFLENVPENARTLALAAAWTEPPPRMEPR